MSKEQEHVEQSLTCLLASLKEAQDSVRSYDTKAQIVGIGYIFSLDLITGFGARLGAPLEFTVFYVVLTWFFVVVPIILFGLVLFPSRKFARSFYESK